MGTLRWTPRISSMDGQRGRGVETPVDTGASFTTLPGSLLGKLGMEPLDKRGFLIADGRRVAVEYGGARATVGDKSVTTDVVFAGDMIPALLDAYTLEGLALTVDPEAQRPVHTSIIL